MTWAAFLGAIRERPDDDGPRLRCADWLDEQGGPADVARAEWIRIEVALARTPTIDPRWSALSELKGRLRAPN